MYEWASLEFPVKVLKKKSFHHLIVSFDWNYPWNRVDNKYCIPHTAKYVLVTTSDQCESVCMSVCLFNNHFLGSQGWSLCTDLIGFAFPKQLLKELKFFKEIQLEAHIVAWRAHLFIIVIYIIFSNVVLALFINPFFSFSTVISEGKKHHNEQMVLGYENA
jgi:hypothetical protein